MSTSELPKIKLPDDAIFAEAEFSRGIVRDMPRSSIPSGGLYDAVDFMIDRAGMAYKRGGTQYQGGDVGGGTGGVGFVAAPEFPTGLKVIALGYDGHVYDVTTETGSVDAGSLGIVTVDNPHLHVDRLAVAASDGVTPPKKITSPGGTVTLGAWGGSPPPGRLVTVHLSRLILANTQANPNRIYFSPPINPEGTWNTAEAYIDTNHFISGICPCQGVLLVFSGGHTERIVGDIPPGTSQENMSVQPVGEVGCVDARSIAPWRGNVVFAGQGGIWVTNGVGFDSLIEKDDGSGISSYWRDLYDVTAMNGGIFAGGIYGRDYYFLSCSYGSTLVDTLVCYMPRKAWARLSNVGVRSFANAFIGINELYGGTIADHPGNRVIRFSPVLNPDTTNAYDANGVVVQPVLQFRMVGEGIGPKAYGHGHLTYDLRDPQTVPPYDSPSLRLDFAPGIEATGFPPWTTVQEGSPFATTGSAMTAAGAVNRRRFIVNRDAQSLNLKLTQVGPSAQTEVYALEQEVRGYNVTADGVGG